MAPCSKLPPLLVTLAVLLPAPRSLGAGFGVGAGTIDVTKVLAGFPEFSTFSSMLTETNVALAISSRDKVTVLAPDNTAVAAAFSGTLRVPRSLLVDLLALHVVLDYIDEPRLGALQHDRKGEGSVVTTLLQVLGAPPRGVGFLRIYSGDGGRAMLSSATPGGLGRNATVEKLVTAKPYSVAVLQVSGFVVPPGIRVQRAFPPRTSRHMAAPPRKPAAPAPASRRRPDPPRRPQSDTPAPVPQETQVIPIPSVHGGLAAKVPSAAGRSAASWWSGIAAVAVGMTKTTCLHLHL
ncbi:fasciclin-like arabinogalactan protein 3 [Panicum hallii]|uniref:fasciclin-like arabinogalactan protein 3 n=1 Tax=Panicum hallii TaxID=206008 RepID=UPI000DF4E356|nr:fasciclin-like arabinogalactan protein 3 [Panicum hallii]